jgi:hypothetical protein
MRIEKDEKRKWLTTSSFLGESVSFCRRQRNDWDDPARQRFGMPFLRVK